MKVRRKASLAVALFKFGLSIVGVILLAKNFYFVSELLTLLALVALLVVGGAGALALLVLLQEIVRWSARQIIDAKQRSIVLRGGPSFHGSNVNR